MRTQRLCIARWLVVAALVVGLTVSWVQQIDGARIADDAAQSLRMAVNLERHGVISMRTDPPFAPTNYREPMPVVVSAAGIRLIDSLMGKSEPEAYFQGPRAQYLKYQNLIWLALLAAATFRVVWALTSSFYLGVLAVILVNIPFLGSAASRPVNTLETEIPAAAFIMLASLTLTLAYVRRKPMLFALAGALFGILALTKAIELYVFGGLLIALACVFWRLPPREVPQSALRALAVLLLTFACTVAPWMYRNHVQLGSIEVSQRGGIALMFRAAYDQMTPEEYRGAYYVWAHDSVLQRAVGAVLGFSPRDLQRGGRLQRLNFADESDFAAADLAAEKAGRPDQAITYYRRVRAEREQLVGQFESAGSNRPELRADAEMKQSAIALIREHPWRHVALTVAVLWRAALLTLPILLVVSWLAMRRGRTDWLVFVLPALGTVVLYALASDFYPRYGAPIRPIAAVVAVLLVKLIWDASVRAGPVRTRAELAPS